MITRADKSAIIVAAGSGRRMGGVSKPLIRILGKTLFEYVFEAFLESSVSEIIVVCSAENEDDLKRLASASGTDKEIIFVRGGDARSDSVYNGIQAAHGEIICVHDCARPFVTAEIIEEVLGKAEEHGLSSACTKVTDTIRLLGEKDSTPDREKLIAMQTPQAFKKSLYAEARAKNGSKTFTDETSMLESIGIKTEYVFCEKNNMKLTTPDDIIIAEALMKSRGENR